MKKALAILLVMASSQAAFAFNGDVNGDGSVTSVDVTCLYNYLLSGDTSNLVHGDVNEDGNITSADITVVYNILLGTPSETHDYVDLGLPSGTLWATTNVGAATPEECGYYFAWGETEQKDDYDWDTYQWSNGTRYNVLTKYCNKSNYGYNGFVDNLTELEPEDDAATANWGGAWRMPTIEEVKNLLDNCTWEWQAAGNTTFGGVAGYKVTSNKAGYTDKYIFLPASGVRTGVTFINAGSYGYYWSATLCSVDARGAFLLRFGSGNHNWLYDYRFNGRSVRPVCP